jgi:hypothetical protein
VHPRSLLTLIGVAKNRQGSIEDCLAVTAMIVREQLSALSTKSGVRAQVRYLLNATIADKTGALIVGHFAHLPSALHGTTLVCDHGVVCLPPSDRWWVPKPEFPSLQEDPLLALLLAGPCVRARALPSNGCSHPPPFAIGGSVVLTSAAAVIATFDHTETPSLPNRPPQGGVSTFLESVTTLAVISASRAGCLGRTPAELFLRHYVTELRALRSTAVGYQRLSVPQPVTSVLDAGRHVDYSLVGAGREVLRCTSSRDPCTGSGALPSGPQRRQDQRARGPAAWHRERCSASYYPAGACHVCGAQRSCGSRCR